MAAYYHLLAPFEISIQADLKLEKQFADLYGDDFTLKDSKRIERFSPKLLNGERLDWSYEEKTYALPDDTFRNEFVAFARILFEEWRNLYESKFKGKFHATQMPPKELESQISKVKSLLDRYPLASDELDDALTNLEDNYYFAIEGIYSQVVYQGYPIKTDKYTSLLALDFLHSYEKMGVYPDEYAAMFLLTDRIKEKYSHQFTLAKYLFLAGY
ncbi:MAG: hypothetical protein ACKV1O_21170 [Saprospiraceae bacterium]